mmetsp:Transcript_60415/g.125287  ORF Transcript_60415/g.125287 Transcript_60415/m.125287 type:complete len:211 (-) Transcript_60415:10-642(-)
MAEVLVLFWPGCLEGFTDFRGAEARHITGSCRGHEDELAWALRLSHLALAWDDHDTNVFGFSAEAPEALVKTAALGMVCSAGVKHSGHGSKTSRILNPPLDLLLQLRGHLGEIRPSPCDIGLPAPDGHQVVLTDHEMRQLQPESAAKVQGAQTESLGPHVIVVRRRHPRAEHAVAFSLKPFCSLSEKLCMPLVRRVHGARGQKHARAQRR